MVRANEYSEATITDDEELIDYDFTDEEDTYEEDDEEEVDDHEDGYRPIDKRSYQNPFPYPVRHRRNSKYPYYKYEAPPLFTPRFGRKPDFSRQVPLPLPQESSRNRRNTTASSQKSDPELYYHRLANLEDDGLGVSLPDYTELHDQPPPLAPRQVQNRSMTTKGRLRSSRIKPAKSTNNIYNSREAQYRPPSPPTPVRYNWGLSPVNNKYHQLVKEDIGYEDRPLPRYQRYKRRSPNPLRNQELLPDNDYENRDDQDENGQYGIRKSEEDEDERPEDARHDFRNLSPLIIKESQHGGGSRLLRSSSGEKNQGLFKNDRYDVDNESYDKGFLNTYHAIRITLFKNGDEYFPGTEILFRPWRDVLDLDGFLKMISVTKARTMDLRSQLDYIFDTNGHRITSLDEIEEGGSYVVSETRRFIHGSYGMIGESFQVEQYRVPSRSASRQRRKSLSQKSISPPLTKSNSGDGKIVRVVNNEDHSFQYEVLLNLKTTQTFEEILEDMGEVLKIKNANKMYTNDGREIKGFSQLKKDLAAENVFYISSGPAEINYNGSEKINNTLDRPLTSTTNLHRVMSEPNISQNAPTSQNPHPLLSISYSNSRGQRPVNYNTEPLKVTIKGNRKSFFPPNHGYRETILPPPNRITLDWVYGYRGNDIRKNLWVLYTGELLYFVGSVAIIYNRFEETQKYYTGHTEDISCMDLHPNREIVASGQNAGKGDIHDVKCHIRVWNVKTLETLLITGHGDCEVGFVGIAFSVMNIGSYIAAIDKSCDRIMTLWDWNPDGKILGRVATHQEGAYGCSFHPLDNNLLITYGKNILTFWSRRKDGFFERTDVIGNSAMNGAAIDKTINTINFLESGDLVTGDEEGMISIFTVSSEGEYFMSHEFDAHSKGVNCLYMLTRGTLLSGGEKDRRIVAWDASRDFGKILETKLPEGAGSCRTLTPQYPGRNDGNIYVGTVKNIVLEGGLQRKFTPLVWGHSRQVDAVTTHPDDLSFVTAGHDRIVARWRKQRIVWKISVQTECCSIDYFPGGSVVAVGTADGHIIILNAENGAHVTTIRVCASPINALTYNPRGESLACVSQNGFVYLFRVTKDGFTYKKYGKLGGVGGVPLYRIDWSQDGDYFQAASTDYNLCVWNLKSHKMEKDPANFRDIEWLEHTCTVGFPVVGIWNNLNYRNEPSIPSVVHTGFEGQFVSTGDHHGYLRLFQYPCVNPRAEYLEMKTGSGPIYGLDVFFKDSYIVTVGGSGSPSIMRWRIR
ncbi:echinoderm microtubule-associated protein-like CG42247 [Lepeophtheirus salmonis]|nr:echinoderm microtubule-associated protein-like CG42247 [Lepeophtheirus salmonis]